MKKTLVSALTTALVVGAASTTFAAANPFEDVPADHWAYDAVAQLAADGVIEGYGDGTYRGDQEITRYEMAQMVARAMAKGGGDKALIDKLAAEFADELNNLGVRVAALEKKVDNVKWGGMFRYRYIHMSHEGSPSVDVNGDNQSDRTNVNQILLRFEPQMKINEHWTGKARIDYAHAGNMNDAQNEGGVGGNQNGIMLDRMWVQGDYKNLQIHLGKLTYASKADYGLFMNRYISGGSVIFGSDVKVALSIGRINSNNNKALADYAYKANSFATRLGNEASTYGAIEIYNDRAKKFTWGIGYHRLGNRLLESDLEMDSDNYSIMNLGLGYKFTKDFNMTAAWTHAFGADIAADKKTAQAGDIESGQKNSYAIQLNYAGAKASKPGSWGAYVAWRQIGQVSSMGWNQYSLNGPQYAGSRGFEIGVSWAPMKNVTGSVSWFTGKDLSWRGEDMNNKEKVNTIFTEWKFLF